MYIVNDLHGDPGLVEQTAKAIGELPRGETLVLNGDCVGSRGPVMNRIARLYYEVRRGETPEKALLNAVAEVIGREPKIPPWWIKESVHSGVFLKLVANRYKAFHDLAMREQFNVLCTTLQPLSMAAQYNDVKLIYLPGNGEIVLDDIITKDITRDRTVELGDRYYQLMARRGCFKD